MKSENRALEYAREASLGMPGAIKQVADYLLAERSGIERLTMGQIAAHAYVSKPTLVRFAKQAGYAGWKDYRHDFLLAAREADELLAVQSEVDVNAPFGPTDDADEITDTILRIRHLATDEVARSLDREVLRLAASAILSAREVACFGVMQNSHRNLIFASNLALAGVLCRVPSADEAMPVARCLGPGDCVVATSYTGGLDHMPISLVPKLLDSGVTVVAITNSERSPLGDIATYTLGFAPLEHYHDKVASFYSGACTSTILDALFACCYAGRFDEGGNRRKAIVEDLSAHMPTDFSGVEGWEL